MLRISFLLMAIIISKICLAQFNNLCEIYSIGIKFHLNQFPDKKVFVADTVTEDEFSMTTKRCTELFKIFFYCKGSSSIATAENLDSVNSRFKDIFKQYKSVKLISFKENNKLFCKGAGKGWRNFYKRYPGYAGIVFLSLVYFNQHHTRAIFQLSLAS